LVNALELLKVGDQMVTLTNLQDGELIIWLWVLVFGCLFLIIIRRRLWHFTQREWFSHFKLAC
jgi:hypothetical protein